MAKKEPPKPLALLKGDFVQSLDNVMQQGLYLYQAVETVLGLDDGGLSEAARQELRERCDAFRKSMFSA